jgi:hypothetical protein
MRKRLSIIISVFLILFIAYGSAIAESVVYYADPTAADQGAAGTRTIKGLMTAIGSTKQATIVLAHTSSSTNTTYTVSTDLTVSSNITVKVDRGALAAPATGKTLTISGTLDAGDYQIFSGAGTVTGLKYINAKWWGATGDGTTDDTIALQAALNAITDYSSFTLPSGIYNITSKLTLDGSTGDIRMIDFTFEGGAYILATGCGGMELTSVRDSKFNRVAIHRAVLDWTTNDSGLKLIHCGHNNIDISYIGNFYNNLHIYATSAGGHYNYFNLGRIDNGHYGVMYEVDGTGSANTNTFIGGRIGLDSSVKTATAAYAATSYGFYQSIAGSYGCYNLRIYGTTFETLHNGLYLHVGNAIIDSPYIEAITGYWFAGRSVGGIFRIGRWYNSSGTVVGYDASKIGFDTNSTKNVWEGVFNDLDTVSIATETEGGYGWINKYSRDVDFELYTQFTTNSLRLKDPSGQIQVFDKQHTSDASPTSGTYYKGAVVWNSAISLGNTIGWMCTTTGTMGTLSGVTATGTSGEATIIVNDASDLYTGARITIVGVSGSKIIYGVSGTTVYLTTAIDASVTNAAVAYSAAVFYPILTQVAYRSGSASPSGSLTPYYVGEEYLDTSANKWYKSTGTGNTDWAALN